WHPKVIAYVRHGRDPSCGNQVAVIDHLLDLHLDVRKRSAQTLDERPERGRPPPFTTGLAESVHDAILGQQLVDRIQPALVPDLVEPRGDECSSLGSHETTSGQGDCGGMNLERGWQSATGASASVRS